MFTFMPAGAEKGSHSQKGREGERKREGKGNFSSFGSLVMQVHFTRKERTEKEREREREREREKEKERKQRQSMNWCPSVLELPRDLPRKQLPSK